jgi:hypothetical protein
MKENHLARTLSLVHRVLKKQTDSSRNERKKMPRLSLSRMLITRLLKKNCSSFLKIAGLSPEPPS